MIAIRCNKCNYNFKIAIFTHVSGKVDKEKENIRHVSKSAYGYRGRRFEPRHQDVVSLS